MTGKWPKDQVDHINHNRSDNRWQNLREVTNAANKLNLSFSAKNTSGHNGIRWESDRKRFVVKLQKDGKTNHGGRYADISDAIIARDKLKASLGFHKNHGLL